jgi:hypothetical protein
VEGLKVIDYGSTPPEAVSWALGRALDRFLDIHGTPNTDPVQEGIIISLFGMASERAVPFLAPRLLDASPSVRAAAGMLLTAGVPPVGEGDTRAREVERAIQLPLCLLMTYDADNSVRGGGVSAVSGIGARYVWAKRAPPDRVLAALVRASADPEDRIAYQAARNLHSLGRDDLIPANLMQRLREDPEIHTKW